MRDFGVLNGSDVIQILGTLRAEGALAGEEIQCLKAVDQELRTSIEIFLQADHCIHAQASDYEYRLEKILYKKRLLESTQLEELQSQIRLHPEKSVSQLILEAGWLGESDLFDAVSHLSELILFELVSWGPTAFFLDKNRAKPGSLMGFGLDPQKLLSIDFFAVNAEKNLPVLSLMREKLGNPRMILRRQMEIDKEQLSGHQFHVYRYINNRNSLRDIFQFSELGYFDTCAALFQLISWEYVGMGKLDTPRHARDLPRAEKPDMAPPKPAAPKSVGPGAGGGRPPAQTLKRPSPAAEAAARAMAKAQIPRPGQRQFLRRGRGAELLQILVSVLNTEHKNGRLVIDNQKQVVRADVSFDSSEIVHAGTTASKVRFGDLLVKRGLIEEVQLSEALQEQKQLEGVPLGEVLVRHDMLDPNEIPKLVLHQMECVIYEVLGWTDVKFYFEPEQGVQQKTVRVKADFELEDGRLIKLDRNEEQIHNILADADQNLPILLMIREQISNEMIPNQSPEVPSALSNEQKQIMQMIDGEHSIYDILLASTLRYFETYTAIFQLYSMGAIQLQGTEHAPIQRAAAASKVVTPPQRRFVPQPVEEKSGTKVVTPSLEYIMGPENAALMKQLKAAQYLEFRKSLNLVLNLALQEEKTEQRPGQSS